MKEPESDDEDKEASIYVPDTGPMGAKEVFSGIKRFLNKRAQNSDMRRDTMMSKIDGLVKNLKKDYMEEGNIDKTQ